MDTETKKFENPEQNIVKINKYICPLCQIRFGTQNRKSGMVKAVDGNNEEWTVCQECFEEREGKSLFKIKKLSKKERKRLKRNKK
jgi:hypothetical protein